MICFSVFFHNFKSNEHIFMIHFSGFFSITLKVTLWLQNSHRRIGKQSLSEPPMEMAHKLYALRPVLKKNVFTLDIFYKYFHKIGIAKSLF